MQTTSGFVYCQVLGNPLLGHWPIPTDNPFVRNWDTRGVILMSKRSVLPHRLLRCLEGNTEKSCNDTHFCSPIRGCGHRTASMHLHRFLERASLCVRPNPCLCHKQYSDVWIVALLP